MQSGGADLRGLAGVVVLDLGTNIAGPVAASHLAALGAEVIKVERPDGGDSSRLGPPYVGPAGLSLEASPTSIALSHLKRNRAKRSVALNLATDDGRRILKQLASRADVVIENLRPGKLAKLGLAPEELLRENPRLVVCSVTGFGQAGPQSQWAAYDTIIQAMSGMTDHTGFDDGPPLKSALTAADNIAALFTTIAALAALRERDVTGVGQVVDISMLECLLAAVWDEPIDVFETWGMPHRTGNRLPRAAPWNLYPTADGHAYVCALTQRQWASLCEAIGSRELLGLDSMQARIEKSELIDKVIGEWTSEWSKLELADHLQNRGVPCGPVLSAREVAQNPQVLDREALEPVRVPGHGPVGDALAPRFPVRFGGRRPAATIEAEAAWLGQHTVEVLRELGYEAREVEELTARGIV